MAATVKRTLSREDVSKARALAATKGASVRPKEIAAATAAAKAAAAVVPGGAEAEIALALANKGLEVMKSDILVFHGQRLRRRVIRAQEQVGRTKTGKPRFKDVERVVFTPLDWEFHVNGVSLVLAAIGVLLFGFMGWLAWNGVSTGGAFGRSKIEILPGMKTSTYWAGVVDKARALPQDVRDTYAKQKEALQKAECEARGGTWNPTEKTCTLPVSQATHCAQLKAAYDTFIASDDHTSAFWVRQQAAAEGCAWAQ